MGIFSCPAAFGAMMSANCNLMDPASTKNGEVMMDQESTNSTIKVTINFPGFETTKNYHMGIFEADNCTTDKLIVTKRKAKLSLTSNMTEIAKMDPSSFGGGLFDTNTFKIIGNRVAIHHTASDTAVGTIVGCCEMEMKKSGCSSLKRSTIEAVLALAFCVQLFAKMF